MSGNFVIYLIGYIIAIIGVGYAMQAAGLSEEWIIAAVLILIGLGVVVALSRSQRDQAAKPTNAGREAPPPPREREAPPPPRDREVPPPTRTEP